MLLGVWLSSQQQGKERSTAAHAALQPPPPAPARRPRCAAGRGAAAASARSCWTTSGTCSACWTGWRAGGEVRTAILVLLAGCAAGEQHLGPAAPAGLAGGTVGACGWAAGWVGGWVIAEDADLSGAAPACLPAARLACSRACAAQHSVVVAALASRNARPQARRGPLAHRHDGREPGWHAHLAHCGGGRARGSGRTHDWGAVVWVGGAEAAVPWTGGVHQAGVPGGCPGPVCERAAGGGGGGRGGSAAGGAAGGERRADHARGHGGGVGPPAAGCAPLWCSLGCLPHRCWPAAAAHPSRIRRARAPPADRRPAPPMPAGLLEQYDAPHSLPLLAPRPLLIANGELDPRCPIEVRGMGAGAVGALSTTWRCCSRCALGADAVVAAAWRLPLGTELGASSS